jgi:hypothetical protein
VTGRYCSIKLLVMVNFNYSTSMCLAVNLSYIWVIRSGEQVERNDWQIMLGLTASHDEL